MSRTVEGKPPAEAPPRPRARVSTVGVVSFVVCVLLMFAGMAFIVGFIVARAYGALT